MTTYRENAENFELWREAVDPDGTTTEKEFDEMTTEEKIQIQVDCFGPEEKLVIEAIWCRDTNGWFFRSNRDGEVFDGIMPGQANLTERNMPYREIEKHAREWAEWSSLDARGARITIEK